MPDSVANCHPLKPDAAKGMLASLVRQAVRTACTDVSEFPQGLRVEAPMAFTDALAWLRAQSATNKVFWASRDRRVQVAGIGAADVVSSSDGAIAAAFAELQRDLASAHPNLRYYGGMAFDPAGETSAEWAPFGRYRFTLPRFQLENHGSHSYLVCNVLLRSCDDCAREPVDVLNDLETITFPASVPRPQTPRAADRTDYPDEQQWNEGVSEALGAIREGRFDKVVLARRSVFAFDQPVDPLSLLARIVAPAAATYQFCFQPEPGAAFLGATPERLYGRRGRYIESEALASTRPRGADDAEDEALAAELRESDKDRREHAFVVKAIREALEGLCRNVYVSPDVSVLKLPGCQHLQCPLEGILREIPSDAAVINALHPSPAVGGAPRAEALDFIRAHESFDRGWYAGPAGWIGPDSGEFAVAIRSGLVHDNSLSLYSGAGIVDGSTPEGEWKEIDTKLSNALRALTGHDD